MTLKQLEAFYWAATCANFALAATRLHISTSSLSKRLSELEETLGVALFDRSAHRAVLTESGERLLPRAAHLLQVAEETLQAAGDGKGASHCSLGIGELSALTWLPRLATHVRKHHPGMTLAPRVDIGTALEERLHDGSLDCAVVAGRAAHPAIVSRKVAQARFVWVAAAALPASIQTIGADVLEEHPLVTLPPGAGTTRILDDWLLESDLDVPRRFTCNSWGAIAGLLIDGFGVGILPGGWARIFEQREQLRILTGKVALAPLVYTFRHRRNDRRRVIDTMHAAVRASADFSIAPRLL